MTTTAGWTKDMETETREALLKLTPEKLERLTAFMERLKAGENVTAEQIIAENEKVDFQKRLSKK